MMKKNLNQIAQEISAKKRYLSDSVAVTIDAIASECQLLLDDVDNLDRYLQQAVRSLPNCINVYVTDRSYCKLSANVSQNSIDSNFRGQDLSQRPYLQSTIPLKGMVLSNSYEDINTQKTCITLVQAIHQNDSLSGFLIADFNLDELPVPNTISRTISNWKQFKGDPAIRGSLFSQQRNTSFLDMNIDKVHQVMKVLMFKNGVFHFKLHYSSSRCTLWLYDQPHYYRLHDINEILSESVFSCYSEQACAVEACVDDQQLDKVLEQFKALRFADENIYLRSASVNIINGMVGLNFSCDGSHYIPVQEFIENNLDYWLGKSMSA